MGKTSLCRGRRIQNTTEKKRKTSNSIILFRENRENAKNEQHNEQSPNRNYMKFKFKLNSFLCEEILEKTTKVSGKISNAKVFLLNGSTFLLKCWR